MDETTKHRILIIGAGPAGLTAAYELLSKSKFYSVTILEENPAIGGLSRTVNHNGNLMDIGGHRLFSKLPEMNEWWQNLLPLQGQPSKDDVLLGRNVPLANGGPNPESLDEVMLMRHRVSHILFNSIFYDYPISLKMSLLRKLGIITTLKIGGSYIASVFHKLPETNLENFYINRFGRKLYEMFFEYYTENLWGRHPREIDASWGAQRVKGLSISAVFKDVYGRIFHRKRRKIETSLIDEFKYPKFGVGQLWEITAQKVEEMGGTIIRNAKVVSFQRNENGTIESLVYEKDGKSVEVEGDVFISSMPIKDLVAGMNDVPNDVARIANRLPYRDYMTLGVLVKNFKLKNKTSLPTIGNIVSDCWVYVQDRNVKMGRFQIYNNWSPYMVKDLENTVWLGLEYFVNDGDEMWNMTEKDFTTMVIGEMIKLGLIECESDVLDTHLERVKKAYPAYFDTYAEFDTLKSWLDKIPNLYCVGRNGQHRYNNIDHSMMTSFEAVNNILNGNIDKSNIWNVNTEKEYHEEK
ncbi:MAG: NAD(P)/FAD-dependent oxidoreductase [Bacteroidales bacterium]|nr:NAD(P)/FAD-dependent oxidoreductase [Bacteroidales bacterium]